MKNINKKILALIAYILSAVLGNLNADILDVEKDTLKFGFIKLTDCAPIVIAKEKGYFDDEGAYHGVYRASKRRRWSESHTCSIKWP